MRSTTMYEQIRSLVSFVYARAVCVCMVLVLVFVVFFWWPTVPVQCVCVYEGCWLLTGPGRRTSPGLEAHQVWLRWSRLLCALLQGTKPQASKGGQMEVPLP